jgi:hypothetical protein
MGSSPIPGTKYQPQSVSFAAAVLCSRVWDSKSGAGTQDERSEGLSASWGRGNF